MMPRVCPHYCWTLFWSEEGEPPVGWEDDAPVNEPHAKHKYTVYQLEKCPDTQRLHYQGYSEFTDNVTWAAMKNWMGQSLHLEARHGTRTEARDYCMKEETRERGPWEIGVFAPGKVHVIGLSSSRFLSQPRITSFHPAASCCR